MADEEENDNIISIVESAALPINDGTTTVPVNNDVDINSFGPNCYMSSHPVLLHKITKLRSAATTTGLFRAIMREITYHLGYEATSTSLSCKRVDVSVPSGNNSQTIIDYAHGDKLKERVAMIPILRSGLGMVDGMLELLPSSAVHHIGMYRVRGQHPVQYFNRLPRQCEADIAFVLDPLIATASTVTSVVKILEKWGVPKIHVICVIASSTGLRQVLSSNPNISVTVGRIDSSIDEDGNTLPGMGDVGDRLFNLTQRDDEEYDESLLHFSKRKRTFSQG